MGGRRAVEFYGIHFSHKAANAMDQQSLKYKKRKHCVFLAVKKLNCVTATAKLNQYQSARYRSGP